MSRIGKNPIAIPDKVEVKIEVSKFSVKGPKGTLSHELSQLVKIEKKDGKITVTPIGKDTTSRSVWGTTRTILNNMMVGVTAGFIKSLEFNGVGYKAAVTGNKLTLNLGHSHAIDYDLPTGITAKVNKNTIEIHGADKELVGFVAAKVRSFRPPEPYKGKGLRYLDEKIHRKAGKAGAKK